MIASNDIPLYTSQKEAVKVEPKQELIEPESVNKNTDIGNGMYVLKPDISVKTEFVPAPLYVDREKLLFRFPDKAEQILSDITNKNPLPDDIAQTLITEKIIVNEKPVEQKKKKKSFFKGIVNTIYNLIFS